MNAKKNSQGGFSLIELLVVVAIIGVLAAAGMVGYTSYLDGVKKDTHKNNAKALAQALKTTAVARVGNLSGIPTGCADTNTRTQCADALAAAGGFASTLLSSKVTGANYVVAAPELGDVCAGSAGLLVIQNSGFVVACSADSTPVPLETPAASFGIEW